MLKCQACQAPLKGDEKFCGKCGAACATAPPMQTPPQIKNPQAPPFTYPPPPPRNGSAPSRSSQASTISPWGRAIFFALLMALIGGGSQLIRKALNRPAEGATSGASITFDCVSTSGATQGMSTVLTLNPDGTATMIGLEGMIWYRSEWLGEPKGSDVTIQGVTTPSPILQTRGGDQYIDHLHMSQEGNQRVMVSHTLNMTCRSR